LNLRIKKQNSEKNERAVPKVLRIQTPTTPTFGHPSSKRRGIGAAWNSPPFEKEYPKGEVVGGLLKISLFFNHYTI